MSSRTLLSNPSLNHRKATRSRRSFVPTQVGLAALEVRQVQSTAVLAQGILTVTGTAGNDTIQVIESASAVTADGKAFAVGSVNSIVVNGLDGKDTISVTSKKPATLDGGANDDVLTASSGMDRLVGGDGVNTYPGVAASDIIVDPNLTSGRTMLKAILDKSQSLGGSLGALTAADASVAGGHVSTFQYGRIYWSAATGAHAVWGMMMTSYDARGGASGPLGLPTGEPTSSSSGAITHDFQGGSLIYNPQQRLIRGVFGSIRDKYYVMGGLGGFLGLPQGDELSSPAGRCTEFQGGIVVSSADRGPAFEVHGAIKDKYYALGGGQGSLGLPTSDEQASGSAQVSHFQNGSIYWSGQPGASLGAHVLYGSIRDKYVAMGGPTSFLGLPQGDELSSPAGRYNQFQGGIIVSSVAPGPAFEVHGLIKDKYFALGGGQGLLGLPITDGFRGSDGWDVQWFQGGKIIWRSDAGTHLTFTRNEVIKSLKRSQLDGKLDGSEYAYFRSIAEDADVFVDPSTRNLTFKLIDGDAANLKFQGVSVGGLAPNSPAWKVDDLEREWFEGQDYPTASFNRTNADGSVTNINGGAYSYAAGPLFGNWGVPEYTDIYQGRVGDCSFLASLAETCFRNNSIIRDMFIDNGDSTFTVRFYNQGLPEYVTVDRMLPSGGAAFASTTAGPIWVALAEKAYAQINESNWLNSKVKGVSSYGALDGMKDAVSLSAIAAVSPASGNIDIASAWATGKYLVLDTKSSGLADSKIVPNHAYALVGYSSAKKLYTLFNPWGKAGGTGTDKIFRPGYVYVSAVTGDFTSETYASSAPAAEERPTVHGVRQGLSPAVPVATLVAATSTEPAASTVTIRRTPSAARPVDAVGSAANLAARPAALRRWIPVASPTSQEHIMDWHKS